MTAQGNLFPVFLKLTGRTVVVVGAGSVAASKLSALVEAGAAVRVVAPEIGSNIERPGVSIVRRAFQPDDLNGAWLVVAAATPAVNRQVADAADARRVFVNAVDDPASASAYLGGVVRRGGVTFAISTDGRAPALAGLLREGLDAVLPASDLERWMSEAETLRDRWRADGVPIDARRPLLLKALIRRYADTGVAK
ncbi:MAG: bifunctional precorrin-2 dehydrogenase/sirohydrochlorin ferrochelatase [Vicinamibacterales bacterium]